MSTSVVLKLLFELINAAAAVPLQLLSGVMDLSCQISLNGRNALPPLPFSPTALTSASSAAYISEQ